jgi:hypothetical protein
MVLTSGLWGVTDRIKKLPNIVLTRFSGEQFTFLLGVLWSLVKSFCLSYSIEIMANMVILDGDSE